MASEQVPAKPQAMIDFLRGQIISGQLGENTRLPALRELMVKFKLSYGSAKRGIDYLCSLELAEKRGGSGVFVRSRTSRPSGPERLSGVRICVFMPYALENVRPWVFPTVMLGIQKAAAAAGCQLSLHFLPVDAATPEHIDERSRGFNGLIMLGEYDRAVGRLPLHIPAVGVCMHNTFGGTISAVDLDPFLSAELAVLFFQRHCVREVTVILDPTRSPAYLNRAELFIAAWQAAGGTADTLIHDTGRPVIAPALFVTGSLLQEASIAHLERTGKVLSAAVTVLGLDGKQLIDPDFHPAPTVVADWQSIGRTALRECINRIELPGSAPRRIYLPVRLVEP